MTFSYGTEHTAAVGATSASRLAWIPYAARRSCPTPLCRWLRSACSAIRAQCWAKLSRESNVSGSEVTSAIFRQSHATSLYSSAAFIGIAKALLCASPVPCACNGIPALAVPGSRPKISNGNVLWNWSIAKIYVRPQLVEIRGIAKSLGAQHPGLPRSTPAIDYDARRSGFINPFVSGCALEVATFCARADSSFVCSEKVPYALRAQALQTSTYSDGV